MHPLEGITVSIFFLAISMTHPTLIQFCISRLLSYFRRNEQIDCRIKRVRQTALTTFL